MNKKEVTLYTDGACKGNPGIGGWGALLLYGHHRKEIYGGEPHTTNNRMELTAVIKGLAVLKHPCTVHLHVDSKYVMQGMTEWIAGWKQRNWQTASKKPVKNIDLWQALDQEIQRHDIQWHWVKGHAGDSGNERADALANLGVESVKQTMAE